MRKARQLRLHQFGGYCVPIADKLQMGLPRFCAHCLLPGADETTIEQDAWPKEGDCLVRRAGDAIIGSAVLLSDQEFVEGRQEVQQTIWSGRIRWYRA